MNGAMARPAASPPSRHRGLWLRIASALVLAPSVLLAVHLGSAWYAAMVAIGALVLVWEWNRLVRGSRTGALVASLVVVAAVVAAAVGQVEVALVTTVTGAFAVSPAMRGDAWTALGVLYVGVPATAFTWLRFAPASGELLVVWLLACVWACDTGAYAFGRLIGGPRLAPVMSPNKTWAGFVGGIVCACAAGLLVATWGGSGPGWPAAIVSAAIGFASQGGDLLESIVKRHFGVKDASGLIPGHGGLLDRVDGLITASLVAALIVLSGHGSIVPWM